MDGATRCATATSVVNLQAKVISVVDLQLKFGLDEIEQTCIIVVDVGKPLHRGTSDYFWTNTRGTPARLSLRSIR